MWNQCDFGCLGEGCVKRGKKNEKKFMFYVVDTQFYQI